MNYFKLYHPKKVEWINDSSCNIMFQSERFTEEAFQHLTQKKDYTDRKLFDISTKKKKIYLKDWRCSFPFTKDRIDLILEMRYATDKDVKNEETKPLDSQYYKYVKEKKLSSQVKVTLNFNF